MDCTSIKMKWNVDEWVSIFNFLSIAQTDPQIKKSNDSWWMRISSSSINGYGVAHADLHSVFHMHHFRTLWIHSCWRCSPNRVLLVVRNNSVFVFSHLYSLLQRITLQDDIQPPYPFRPHSWFHEYVYMHVTRDEQRPGSWQQEKKNPKKKERAVKKLLFHFGMWDEGV